MGGSHVKRRCVRSLMLAVSAAAMVLLFVAWVDSYYRVGVVGWGWAQPQGIRAVFVESEAGRLRVAVGSPPAAHGAVRAGPFSRRGVLEADAPPAPPVYVKLAEAELKKAEVGLSRMEKLYASEVAVGRSNTEIDLARADVAVAQATLELRKFESRQRPPPPAAAPVRFLPRWEPQGWDAIWIRYRHGRGVVGSAPLRRAVIGRTIEFPHWMPLLLAAAPLALAARAARRRRLRLRRGLCLSCGYDLRGSGERCPECGTPVTAGPAAEKGARQSHDSTSIARGGG